MNRREYFNNRQRRRRIARASGMANALGALLAVLGIIIALGLIFSLSAWVRADMQNSFAGLINTVLSVITHPVGEAVVQLN